jgi:hypothetical protein
MSAVANWPTFMARLTEHHEVAENTSAPHEPAIMVATRLRNTAFTLFLKRMPLDSQVKIEGSVRESDVAQ